LAQVNPQGLNFLLSLCVFFAVSMTMARFLCFALAALGIEALESCPENVEQTSMLQSLGSHTRHMKTRGSVGNNWCCWSKWGDASTCGKYPSGTSGARCGKDGVTPCSSNADCDNPRPTPRPTPRPPPAPTPRPTPRPPPAPTPPPPGNNWCCWSKWGDASTCGKYPSGTSGARCGKDGVTPCSNNADCENPQPTPRPTPRPTQAPTPRPTQAPTLPPPGTLPGTPLRELAAARGLLFGTNIHDTWPNPWQTEDAYIHVAQTQFNVVNWDWQAQWTNNQPNGPDDEYNFDGMDALLPFMVAGNFTARTNAIMTSAHNLLHPVGSGTPQWLIDGYQKQAFTTDQLQGFVKRHIDTVVPHWLSLPNLPFNGLITVNEAVWNQDMAYKYGSWPANWVFGPDTNLWRGAWNGTDDPLLWFKKTFEWTRQAVDAAGFDRTQIPLFYNDYSIETATAKADAVHRLLKEMLAAGVPIDGVGFQAHMQCDCMNYPSQPGCNDAAVIAANMQRFIDLGLKVRITEVDVTMVDGCTEEMQADVYGALLQACLEKAPDCDSYMLWGFTDNYNWFSDKKPCILDTEYQPKPAFFRLQETLTSD